MEDFWAKLLSQLGNRTLYVDSSAILGAIERDNEQFRNFFREAVGYRYVTSTYVLTETVRRLVKSKSPTHFIGPSGETCKELSHYFLTRWLEEHQVHVICVPDELFGVARVTYREQHGIQCDLTDIISYTVVRGLRQEVILSTDWEHFGALGLSCLP